MGKASRVAFRELGLEVGVILAEQVFETDHLHYGHWSDGLEPKLRHLREAQDRQCAFIESHIPDGVETILDVGCGVGAFARRLVAKGYAVDCVTPSAPLAERARKRLGDESNVYLCGFEDLQVDRRYDLVLFSESFQYVPLDAALEQSMRYVKEGGFLLVCDFFKTHRQSEGHVGGGHNWDVFQRKIAQRPLEELENIDITAQMAPTIDMENDVFQNVVRPIWRSTNRFMDRHHAMTARILRWVFKRKIAKLERKCFSGQRTAADFAGSKTYRLCLYRKLSS